MSYRPICDLWLLARPKVKYYGAYPNGFLERARVLIGASLDDPVLHVCSGRVSDYPGRRGFGARDQTLDSDPSLLPDYVRDARLPLPRPRGPRWWHACLADPPYTEEDAEHYGIEDSPMREERTIRAILPSPRVLVSNMIAVVRPGGRVGLLHYLSPSAPKGAMFVACVGVIDGFNNRIRAFSVYERDFQGEAGA